jgi:hypothetical protein
MHQYKIFIAGSIGIKNIDDAVVERIKNIVDQQYQIMVGDANGVDSLIQHILKDMQTGDVTVYCASKQPRNNLGNWFVKTIESKEKPGTRAFFTAKDIKMAENCDYGLMVWDAKSTGTLKNVIELLKRNKISLICDSMKGRFSSTTIISSKPCANASTPSSSRGQVQPSL